MSVVAGFIDHADRVRMGMISADDDGYMVHVRLFPPVQDKPVEIDWIELWQTGSTTKRVERWDFTEPP